MHLRFAALGLSLAVVLIAGGSQNQPQEAQAPDFEQRSAAIDLIRVINSAEMAYKWQNRGSFGAWDDLEPSDPFKAALARTQAAQVKNANLSDPANIMPGWRLRLFTSNNGNHYAVIVDAPPTTPQKNLDATPTIPNATTPRGCVVSFFSDDEGLIREGKAIDCPVMAVPQR